MDDTAQCVYTLHHISLTATDKADEQKQEKISVHPGLCIYLLILDKKVDTAERQMTPFFKEYIQIHTFIYIPKYSELVIHAK